MLLEDFVYDDDGNPLTTTFIDYLLPTTTEVPDIEIGHIDTPSTTNPGGFKGMGEGRRDRRARRGRQRRRRRPRPPRHPRHSTPLGPNDIHRLLVAAGEA